MISPGVNGSRPGLGARLMLGVLAGYKRYLSPLLPPSCRYSPTCSEYAALAVRQRGVWSGGWLAVARVARCQPFAAGGLDLPPAPRSKYSPEFRSRNPNS